MLTAPHLTGDTHAALHFVEDEKDVVFVADLAELFQPFAPEMIIAALALDRFDDDGADVDLAPLSGVDVSMYFLFGFFLTRNDVALALVFRQRKIDVWAGNARPVKFREQIRFPRISIGQAHGVATAAVEGVPEMQNLRSPLAVAGGHVFADFPIHRCLKRVLDRERAAFDE